MSWFGCASTSPSPSITLLAMCPVSKKTNGPICCTRFKKGIMLNWTPIAQRAQFEPRFAISDAPNRLRANQEHELTAARNLWCQIRHNHLKEVRAIEREKNESRLP